MIMRRNGKKMPGACLEIIPGICTLHFVPEGHDTENLSGI